VFSSDDELKVAINNTTDNTLRIYIRGIVLIETFIIEVWLDREPVPATPSSHPTPSTGRRVTYKRDTSPITQHSPHHATNTARTSSFKQKHGVSM
jgi:hypothetical protein